MVDTVNILGGTYPVSPGEKTIQYQNVGYAIARQTGTGEQAISLTKWIDVTQTGSATLDLGDWRGRTIHIKEAVCQGSVLDSQTVIWDIYSEFSFAVAPLESTLKSQQLNGVFGNDIFLDVDGTDSGKLKFRCTTFAAQVQYRLWLTSSKQSNSSDITI